MIQPLVHPLLGPLDGLGAAGHPARVQRVRDRLRRPAALPGTRNEAIYGDLLGLDAATLARLREDRVI